MKIVVAALSAPAHLNGVSRHAANVVRGLLLRSEITEIHILAGQWQQNTFQDAVARDDARLHIHSVNIGRGTLSRNLWYYRELPRIALQLNADVVHLAYPVPMAAHEFHCPVVVSLHDLYPFDSLENFGVLKGMVNRLVVRQCLRSVDAIACVSECTRNRLGEKLGATLVSRAVTILNGVEPLSLACVRPPYALRGCCSFFLCIAQHRSNKNIGLVIRVFERVLRMGLVPSASRLVVIGVPGPETAKIEHLIREIHFEQKVLLLSGITDSELQWCYRNCELLMAPSTMEGFGLPVAEALLAGCKTVCSDIPAFREIGGETCRYVELGKGELERFVQAVGEVLALPRLTSVSLPQLAVDQITEKYIGLYRRLLTWPASPEVNELVGSRAGRSSSA